MENFRKWNPKKDSTGNGCQYWKWECQFQYWQIARLGTYIHIWFVPPRLLHFFSEEGEPVIYLSLTYRHKRRFRVCIKGSKTRQAVPQSFGRMADVLLFSIHVCLLQVPRKLKVRCGGRRDMLHTFYLFIFYVDSSSVVTEPWPTSLQPDVFNPGIKFGTIASARAFVAHVKTTTPSNVTQSRSESGEFSRNAFR